MVDIGADVKDIEQITADVAAQNPRLVAQLDAFYEAKKAEFEKWAEAQFGGKPQVQDKPVISTEKSQADVIAEMQSTIAALQKQLNQAQANPTNTATVVMEGGEPVPHTLFLDNGAVVQNHAGLATHYSVTVPATATQDEHEEIHKVVAAYPA